MIQKFVSHPKTCRYYLSGPQRFAGGMWDVLEELGVSAQRIHGEEFTGY
jgi:ferredoxin-NADP reductase